MARESEYGGEDTYKTQGVQPKQPNEDLSVKDQLRLLYATDQDYPDSVPDREAVPRYLKEG